MPRLSVARASFLLPLLVWLIAAFLACSVFSADDSGRPNVVVIITDDK